ncbi:MAG: 16S rRNA (cytidine(1402)-2'-O)-methyltransferase [Myxococcota bacterium]
MPLHVVATPIGNLEDVTLRALSVLREAELVLAEDTRRTRVLLDRHGIEAKPVSLHAHNEAARIERALAVLARGGSVALVSDAGTPLVSDPGERLVRAAVEAGHPVVPVPGASAPLAALAASGLPAEPFLFQGFLPRKAGARDARLRELADRPETLVFFESPKRLAGTLERLLAAFGDRPACVARELTKLHEEWVRGPLSELAKRFADGTRGEVTLVVGGAPPSAGEIPDADLDAALRAGLAAGRSSKELASELAKAHGRPRRDVYARILALRGESVGE